MSAWSISITHRRDSCLGCTSNGWFVISGQVGMANLNIAHLRHLTVSETSYFLVTLPRKGRPQLHGCNLNGRFIIDTLEETPQWLKWSVSVAGQEKSPCTTPCRTFHTKTKFLSSVKEKTDNSFRVKLFFVLITVTVTSNEGGVL